MKKIFLLAVLAGSLWAESYIDMRMNGVHKPLFVVVTANHCPYCERQKRVIENNAVLRNFIDENFQYATVNMSRVPVPGELQPIYGTPTVFVVEKSGDVVARRDGYQGARSLLNFLQQALAKRTRKGEKPGIVVQGEPVR